MATTEIETRDLYKIADQLFSIGSGTHLPVPFQCCVRPVDPTRPFGGTPNTRLATLHEFFDGCLSIFKDALRGKHSHVLYRWLLNDTPASLRRKWHLALPSAVYAHPLFFRTDEGPSGEIMEVQCPGSGWGDLQYLRDLYLQCGGLTEDTCVKLDSFRPANAFAQEVRDYLKIPSPSVLHLLDNASRPGSMKYLIAATSPPLQYWGYSPGVDYSNCHLIRSHSFFGLVTENFFKLRVRAAGEGLAKFDLPPIALFDQKASLALPFWEETRDCFSDRVRAALVFSYPLTTGGFRDEHGAWVSLDEFAKRPPSQRRYFFKYAGVDVTENWGSRAVFRASDKGFKKTLEILRQEIGRGRPWIIQPDSSGRETVSYFNRKEDKIVHDHLYTRYSRFYGPSSLIGTRVMYRKSAKVHGQKDTAVGIVL